MLSGSDGPARSVDVYKRQILPFAENYRYLAPLLENCPDTQAIAELGRLSEARRTRPAAFAGLRCV